MRIGILGRGRLGSTLAILLDRAGHTVDLRGRGEIPDGDVVLLAVPDRAIREAAVAIPLGPAILHLSGSAGLAGLDPHRPRGSLHPLMTFPGADVAIPDLTGVAAAIDGDGEAIALAEAIARSLGMRPISIPGDRRLYHAAAVMAGNFSTVLLAEAARSLEAAGIPGDEAASALLPLAIASLRNAARDPERALTGPAARGDQETISAHREALKAADLGDTLALYEGMTEATRRRIARIANGYRDA